LLIPVGGRGEAGRSTVEQLLGNEPLSAKRYGARGDGESDDTISLTNWIHDINLGGGVGYLPYGRYMVAASLPFIAAHGARIVGAGHAQANYARGSVISALPGDWSHPMLTLVGEGVEISEILMDGQGRVPTLVRVRGANCRLLSMGTHGVQSGGVCLDVDSGATSIWIDNCRINGINRRNVGIRLNATDAIISKCKPTNNTHGFLILGGANGAQILGNHITPGSAIGENGIYITESVSHISIDANRFDNWVRAAIQITPGRSSPNNIMITNNIFYGIAAVDSAYPYIGVDTTYSSVRGLHIVGNAGYCSASSRPAYGLASIQQDGGIAQNPTRLKEMGSLFSANNFWVSSQMFGPGAEPTVARGNIVTTDGRVYSAAADV
jgi:hypothetical protein